MLYETMKASLQTFEILLVANLLVAINSRRRGPDFGLSKVYGLDGEELESNPPEDSGW